MGETASGPHAPVREARACEKVKEPVGDGLRAGLALRVVGGVPERVPRQGWRPALSAAVREGRGRGGRCCRGVQAENVPNGLPVGEGVGLPLAVEGGMGLGVGLPVGGGAPRGREDATPLAAGGGRERRLVDAGDGEDAKARGLASGRPSRWRTGCGWQLAKTPG